MPPAPHQRTTATVQRTAANATVQRTAAKATVHQLRPVDDDEVNIESLALSALLSTKAWKAPAYGVTDDMFVTFGQVFEWCESYVRTAGESPPVDVVVGKFPALQFVPDYNLDFAVKELKAAHAERVARIHLHAAASDVAKGDMASYRARLLEATAEAAPEVSPVSVADPSLWEHDDTSVGTSVGTGLLQALTGGIRPGDYWVYAARLAAGKSWRLIDTAVHCALNGMKVTYFSLEMTARQVAWRVADVMGRGKKLNGADIGETFARKGGAFTVFDPSHGRTTPDAVAAAAGDSNARCMAVVDHLGLMFSNKGQRSIEDHRVAAEISDTLKEVALAYDMHVLAAAQINRTGARVETAPAAHQVAGTDAVGQGVDVLLTMRRASNRVMVNRLAKNRGGDRQDVMWYSKFLPQAGDFTDLQSSTAREWIATDADMAESQL